MRKTWFAACALALAALNATAHGDATAMYGGTVQTAADLQFELVAQPNGAALFVVDHGKPADVSEMSGKLVVLNGTAKSQAELKPAGANKLEAVMVALGKGAKAVATVYGAGSQPITVRFNMN